MSLDLLLEDTPTYDSATRTPELGNDRLLDRSQKPEDYVLGRSNSDSEGDNDRAIEDVTET